MRVRYEDGERDTEGWWTNVFARRIGLDPDEKRERGGSRGARAASLERGGCYDWSRVMVLDHEGEGIEAARARRAARGGTNAAREVEEVQPQDGLPEHRGDAARRAPA